MSEGKIVISNDLQYAQEFLVKQINSDLIKTFFIDEFKVDDVKEVIKQAYIAESHTKYLLLSANSYNVYAQNALLKMLEEPPGNIVFILIAKSKTSFLPTIRSRLPIEILKTQKNELDLGLNLKTLDLNHIYAFIQGHKSVSKVELKEIIETLLKDALLSYRLTLSGDELNVFKSSLELAELNTRPQILLSLILLTILNRKCKV